MSFIDAESKISQEHVYVTWVDGGDMREMLKQILTSFVFQSRTRDSTLCRVGRSVRPKYLRIAIGLRITAPAQPSATGLPCIWPCFLSHSLLHCEFPCFLIRKERGNRARNKSKSSFPLVFPVFFFTTQVAKGVGEVVGFIVFQTLTFQDGLSILLP